MLSLSGCYNNTEEELYGVTICDLQDITYANEVTSILSTNCYACHSQNNGLSSGAGIILEGYDNLKVAVNNELLLKAITHSQGASPMPKNGAKLLDCDIDVIRTWISNGAPNN